MKLICHKYDFFVTNGRNSGGVRVYFKLLDSEAEGCVI